MKSKYDNMFHNSIDIKILFDTFRDIIKQEFKKNIKLVPVKRIGSGTYPSMGLIQLNINQEFGEIVQHFFHELGHNINYRDGKYLAYESTAKIYKRASKKRAIAIVKIGMKAEQGADRVGKKLMTKYMPFIKWNEEISYSNSVIKKLYREQMIKPEKEWLEEKYMRYCYEIPHVGDYVVFYNKEGRSESAQVIAIHKIANYCDALTRRSEKIELTFVSIVRILHRKCLLSEYGLKEGYSWSI
jgi:hypothetical protein